MYVCLPLQVLAVCVRQSPPFPSGRHRAALATAVLDLMFALGDTFTVCVCVCVVLFVDYRMWVCLQEGAGDPSRDDMTQ